MLRFKFNPGAYAPFYGDTHIGCIGGCDTNFMELLAIRALPTQARNQNHTQSNNRNGANETANSSGYASASQLSNSTNSSLASSSNSRPTASIRPHQRPLDQPRQTSSSSNTRNPYSGGAPPAPSFAGTSQRNFPSQSNHRQAGPGSSGGLPNQRPESNEGLV